MAEEVASAPTLTTTEVIALGGWHERYASVLQVRTEGALGFAVAVIDGNGDGQELSLEVFHWDAGSGWQPSFEQGIGPLRDDRGFDDLLETAVTSRIADRHVPAAGGFRLPVSSEGGFQLLDEG